MRILFNDRIQQSNAPQEIKSPALKDGFVFKGSSLPISFHENVRIDCVGIGGYSGNSITISLLPTPERKIDGGSPRSTHSPPGIDGGCPGTENIEFNEFIDGRRLHSLALPPITYNGSGLYMLDGEYSVRTLVVHTKAKEDDVKDVKIGRLAFGKAVHIPTTPAKGLSYAGSAAEYVTASGQVIPGRGGHTYRVLTLDSRYKIDEDTMKNEIIDGYPSIGAGYPFFIDLEDEYYKLPFSKFYGSERNQGNWVFQGGVTRFKYSMKFEFEECF